MLSRKPNVGVETLRDACRGRGRRKSHVSAKYIVAQIKQNQREPILGQAKQSRATTVKSFGGKILHMSKRCWY